MATKLKGITVEIGGDVKGLNKAIQGTNKEIRNTQTELQKVERLLKLDPGNTELLKQKQELLSKAVGETADKLDALKAAKKKADDEMKSGTEINHGKNQWGYKHHIAKIREGCVHHGTGNGRYSGDRVCGRQGHGQRGFRTGCGDAENRGYRRGGQRPQRRI